MTHTFDLAQISQNINYFEPQAVTQLSSSELETRLAVYMWSWGQQIAPAAAATYLPENSFDVQRFLDFYLPFRIGSDFAAVSEASVRLLAVGTAHLHLYGTFLDFVLDSPDHASAVMEVTVASFLFHAERVFAWLFPPSSPFWNRLNQLQIQTNQVLLKERPGSLNRIKPYELAAYKQNACRKMALFGHTHVIGLALLNGAPEQIPVLERCWDALMFLATIDDDVLDWPEDYHNSTYTYLLTQVLLADPFRAELEAGHKPAVTEVDGALFCSDVVETLYLAAARELEEAEALAHQIDCLAVADLLREHSAEARSRAVDISKRKLGAVIAMGADKSERSRQ
ncbi:MAG: hypothetical protein KDI79_07835 [Anaerolineae bacterium]|nr:hypothetical protein [Anaerolineae bacterium]